MNGLVASIIGRRTDIGRRTEIETTEMVTISKEEDEAALAWLDEGLKHTND